MTLIYQSEEILSLDQMLAIMEKLVLQLRKKKTNLNESSSRSSVIIEIFNGENKFSIIEIPGYETREDTKSLDNKTSKEASEIRTEHMFLNLIIKNLKYNKTTIANTILQREILKMVQSSNNNFFIFTMDGNYQLDLKRTLEFANHSNLSFRNLSKEKEVRKDYVSVESIGDDFSLNEIPREEIERSFNHSFEGNEENLDKNDLKFQNLNITNISISLETKKKRKHSLDNSFIKRVKDNVEYWYCNYKGCLQENFIWMKTCQKCGR